MSKASAPRTDDERIPVRPGIALAPKSKLETVAEGKIAHPEAIAQRAYDKFVARGWEHGHDAEDWCAAEAELLAEVKGQSS